MWQSLLLNTWVHVSMLDTRPGQTELSSIKGPAEERGARQEHEARDQSVGLHLSWAF